ncbi:hypothetical protein V5799_005064 [Amblyomma americanum]|uniref:Uncharacterized protein n=1 Tax=Amblyomma americanum TaxID=6943 RepID=A0AAQ4D4B7_AMBAM
MSNAKAEATCVCKDQLDFSKACTSMVPEDWCWLITESPAWNRILCGLTYELVEPLPGNLSLQCLPYGAVDRGPIAAVREAASMVSRLLQHHRCINDLHVVCTTDANDTSLKRAPVPMRPRPAFERDGIRNIRHLEVKTCRAEVLHTLGSSCIPEEDIVGVCDLEELKINSAGGEFDAGLTKLLWRNSCSLKAVEIAGMNLSQRLVDSLQCLKRCVSLVLSFCRNEEGNHYSADIFSMLKQSSAAPKNFSFLPFIDSQWSVSAIVDALKSSVTLTPLELHMYQSTSWARELFAALGVNTSIKNLRIGFRGAIATCGDVLASAQRKNSSLLELDLKADVDDELMICIAESLSQNASLDTVLFTRSTVYARGVLALCSALPTNKTLKQLLFPNFKASIPEKYGNEIVHLLLYY